MPYRLDENGAHIGVFGNEVKTENRPMMQRWLLDQCRQLRRRVRRRRLPHRPRGAGRRADAALAPREPPGATSSGLGEPWIASADPDFEANPDWDWYKVDAPLTFFQDDARNAFKGPTGEPVADAVASRGYAGGDPLPRESAHARDHQPLARRGRGRTLGHQLPRHPRQLGARRPVREVQRRAPTPGTGAPAWTRPPTASRPPADQRAAPS